MEDDKIIQQLEQKIKLNEEIISNLKEFFGTYLSNFLKEYRDQKQHNDEKLQMILERQDRIFHQFHKIMKQK